MTTTAHFTVTGMTCGHCVSAVTEEVKGLDGVTDVQVVLEDGSLTITSEREIDFADVAAAVDEAGYSVSRA
jgi:copper chaperone